MGPPLTTLPTRVDVVIVGAGPVGCALAILLGQRGRRVAVLERHRGPYPLPRAVHFDDEVARILQACGLGEALPALSEPATTYEWRNGDGVPLLRFASPLEGRQGWPSANMFNQPDLEVKLLERLAALATVTTHFATTVTEVGQDPDHAWVAAVDAHGVAHRIDAPFVVGCDGANSTVRDELSVTFEDRGFFFDWLVVDVALHEPRVFDPPNVQVCDPRRPTTVVSGGPGRRRWEFMCVPGESLETLDDEASAWAFLADWDVRPDHATMVRHAGYRFRARWATSWRDRRVLLAGDAAHLTPPFAGQGMCAGMRDAANLAWKLDYVLTHPDATELLATYDQERIPQAAAVIELATELGKVICIADPDEARERDALMAPLVPSADASPAPSMPPLTSGLLHDSAHAGELWLQAVVRAGDVEGLFDDVVGAGWHLVTRQELQGLDHADREWFANLGGRVVTLGDACVDVSSRYTEWFEDHDLVAVLERPDLALFGSAAATDEVGPLLRDLRHQLESTHRSTAR